MFLLMILSVDVDWCKNERKQLLKYMKNDSGNILYTIPPRPNKVQNSTLLS
jgi:hypothetical protein